MHTILIKTFSKSLLLAIVFGIFGTCLAPIPVTGKLSDFSINQLKSPNNLTSFIAMVATNNNSKQVVGVFQHGTFRAPVVQQPGNAPGFVSTEFDKVTQFRMANQYGVTALLAHNYLAGQNFKKIRPGSLITIVYGNGRTVDYMVEEIRQYQALSPNSPYSNFINLADTDQNKISATDLFYDIYTQDGRLVLQTCIEKDGELSWGRLFIIASRFDSLTLAAIH